MAIRKILLTLTLVICTVCAFPFEKDKLNSTNKEYDLYGDLFKSRDFFNELLSNTDRQPKFDDFKSIGIVENLNDTDKMRNHLVDVIKVVEKIGRDISEKHKPWTVVVQKTKAPIIKSTEMRNSLNTEETEITEKITTPTSTQSTTTSETEQTTVKTTTPVPTQSTPSTESTKTTSSQQDKTTPGSTVTETIPTTEGTTTPENDKNSAEPLVYKVAASTSIQILIVAVAAVLL